MLKITLTQAMVLLYLAQDDKSVDYAFSCKPGAGRTVLLSAWFLLRFVGDTAYCEDALSHNKHCSILCSSNLCRSLLQTWDPHSAFLSPDFLPCPAELLALLWALEADPETRIQGQVAHCEQLGCNATGSSGTPGSPGTSEWSQQRGEGGRVSIPSFIRHGLCCSLRCSFPTLPACCVRG